MAIYNLTEKAYIWWQDIKKVKGIKERYVTWKTFKKLFKIKYLSEQYYEEKDKEFCELKLRAMTMKELCSKFLILLLYVPYIIDEKPKIQWFLSCIPLMFKERIEYDNPKTLKEAMRKGKFYLTKTRIKEKVYQLRKIKGQIILILKENKISSIKTWEIIIEGIR